MGGRSDYEERKEERKLRYEQMAKKAKEKSHQYMNSNASRILEITPRTTNIIWTLFRKETQKINREG